MMRPHREIQGRCPACRNATLFLGDGGHITCSWTDCPNPGAVGEILEAMQHIKEVEDFLRNLDAFRKLVSAMRTAAAAVGVSPPDSFGDTPYGP